MAKKSVRKIPRMVLSVKGDGAPDPDLLISNEVFSEAVYKEAVEGIRDAIKNKATTAILFEVGVSEYYVQIEKRDWIPALQICLDRFVEKEQYEQCIEIQEMINKIK